MASSLRVGLCDRALPRTGYTVVSSVLRRVCNVRSRDSFGNFRFFFLEGRSNDSRKEAPRTRLSVLFCFLVRSRYFVAPSSARFVPSSVWGRRCCSWQKTNLRARGAPYKDYVLSKENNGRVFSFRVFFLFPPSLFGRTWTLYCPKFSAPSGGQMIMTFPSERSHTCSLLVP